MTQSTYQDAELLLKLYDMRREERLRTARAWFIANFSAGSVGEAMEKYPHGSDHNAYYRMVSTYWDMAESFIIRGVLNEKLFFKNNMEMLMVCEKMKDLVADLRSLRRQPTMY